MTETQQPVVMDESFSPFPGLTQEWYGNHRIVLYRVTAVSNIVVENWQALVLSTLEKWDRTEPYLAVHDLSQPGISLQFAAIVHFDLMNIGITSDGRHIAEKNFEDYPDFSALIAINFNLSLSGQTNHTLLKFVAHNHPSIRYKAYYSRSKCLNWLANKGVSDTSTSEFKALSVKSEDSNSEDDMSDMLI